VEHFEMFPHVGFFTFGGRIWSNATARMSMVKSVSIMSQCLSERCRSVLVHIALLGPDEHVALLVDLRSFTLLRRWDDLLDEGVAAIFDLTSGEAELLALSFHAGQFTPARAATWLADRVLRPLFFLPTSGTRTVGRAGSRNNLAVNDDRGFQSVQ
jgi:hypothetical protein